MGKGEKPHKRKHTTQPKRVRKHRREEPPPMEKKSRRPRGGGNGWKVRKQPDQVGPDPKLDRASTPKAYLHYPKGVFDKTAPTFFQPSKIRKSNANKMMIENARYLTPDEERSIGNVMEKQDNLIQHLKGEYHAQATGKYAEWEAKKREMEREYKESQTGYTEEQKMQFHRSFVHQLGVEGEKLQRDTDRRIKYGDQEAAVAKSIDAVGGIMLENYNSRLAQSIKNGTPIEQGHYAIVIGPEGVHDMSEEQARDQMAQDAARREAFLKRDLDTEDYPGKNARLEEDEDFEGTGRHWFTGWRSDASKGWKSQYKELRAKYGEIDAQKQMAERIKQYYMPWQEEAQGDSPMRAILDVALPEVIKKRLPAGLKDNPDGGASPYSLAVLKEDWAKVAQFHPNPDWNLKGRLPVEELTARNYPKISEMAEALAIANARRVKVLVEHDDLKVRQAHDRVTAKKGSIVPKSLVEQQEQARAAASAANTVPGVIDRVIDGSVKIIQTDTRHLLRIKMESKFLMLLQTDRKRKLVRQRRMLIDRNWQTG
jgi:hypothetical protein